MTYVLLIGYDVFYMYVSCMTPSPKSHEMWNALRINDDDDERLSGGSSVVSEVAIQPEGPDRACRGAGGGQMYQHRRTRVTRLLYV